MYGVEKSVLTEYRSQPADIFERRQNDFNVLLYLTTKHVFEIFWGKLPG